MGFVVGWVMGMGWLIGEFYFYFITFWFLFQTIRDYLIPYPSSVLEIKERSASLLEDILTDLILGC